MKKKRIILIVVVIAIVIAGASVILFNHGNSRSDSSSSSEESSKITVVHPKGKWSGVKKYPNNQSVTVKFQFKANHQYKLIEENTVSQCWTRTYTGGYTRDGNKITCIPEQVIASTYSSKDAMKKGEASATDTVSKDQFYKQFGNQQHSILTLKRNSIAIVHDEEHITMTQN